MENVIPFHPNGCRGIDAPDLSSPIEIRKRLFAPRVLPEAEQLRISFADLRSAKIQRSKIGADSQSTFRIPNIVKMAFGVYEWLSESLSCRKAPLP